MKPSVLITLVTITFGIVFAFMVLPVSFQMPNFLVGNFSRLTPKEVQPLQLIKILFVGDVMLARDVEQKMNLFSSQYPFEKTKDIFIGHDYTVINFEGSIPKQHVPTPGMTFRFSVKESDVSSFSDLNITHASLANNHGRDYGNSGIQNTKEVLEQNNTSTFGQSLVVSTTSVSFIESTSTKIALVGIDVTLSTPSDEELESIFSYASVESDMQIVYVHWGNEYKLNHSSLQEKFATKFVTYGADLVIGHHPHVVQDIQKINDVLVFYSLGNFIFDQYFSKDVQEGLALSVSLGTTPSITLIPVTTMGSKTQPREMSSFEASELLTSLAKRSDSSISNEILSGKISFSLAE